ncbi:MAG: hypothetical protein HY079_00340, partial [Elusimicrobia bacterium]|nr:hypothetical protein [Elusimicrobiota bacterium]
MTRFARAAVLLLAVLGAARAQPGPRRGAPDFPPVDLAELARETRARPTDSRSVNPRMRQLMLALRMRGVPPAPHDREKLEGVRELLARGDHARAAAALDAVIARLAAEPGPESFRAPAPAEAARPAAAPAEPAMLSEAPRL